MVYLSQSNLCLMVSPGPKPPKSVASLPPADVGARDTTSMTKSAKR